MDAQKYTNFAFISYKREDEKWAKWLQKRLESYKLPATIRKETPSLPKYIRPIFRDGTDLSGGILANKLHDELVRSRFLIVICSPNATKSEWINREAQTFINEGRTESIIPFIVDGVPYSDDGAKECFPDALLNIPEEKELLGINVQEVGKDMAFIRLVATMLGIRFDALWQRHRRALIQKRIAYGVVAVIWLLLGIFVWDYNRATYDYFADWVDCYGVPEGVIPLVNEQVSHRSACYQFEYRRIPFGEPNAYSWRIAKVSYVNSALRPKDITDTEMKDRYPIQEIEYNKKTGIVSRINFCDTKGKVLLRHVLSERDGVTAAVADFLDSQEQRGTGFVGAELSSMSMGQMDAGQQKSNIVRYVYERDEKGHIVKQTYHANNDYQLQRSSISDADGIFGRSFTLDSLGRRIKVEYLGLEGERACTKKGIAGRLYEYDEYGNMCKTTYVNLEGNPTLNEELWASCVAVSDEWGNVKEGKFYGTDGNMCLTKGGSAKCILKYDDNGNVVKKSFFGTDDKLCITKNGYSIMENKFDYQGNVIEQSYFDTNNRACLNADGVALYRMEYDRNGELIRQVRYDADKKICFGKNGVAIGKYKYDDFHNRIETSFWDVEEKQCLIKDGYAKYTVKYDNRGNIVEEAYFDVDGKPCIMNDGYAKSVCKYDDRGNNIETSYFGQDGKLCLNFNGYAKVISKYDERGNMIEAIFYGIDGNPCIINDGSSKWETKYDERGRIIEMAYFDIDGNPCEINGGFSKRSQEYDVYGNMTELRYFGVDGKPCLSNEEFSMVHYEYDNRGNIVKRSYFGVDGLPCHESNGVCVNKVKFDNKGNVIESSFYDAKGMLCMTTTEGGAFFRAKYDDRGNRTEVAYFGTDKAPCLSNFGFSKSISRFDNYDNIIEEAYFATNGKPCLHNDGYARWVAKYNEYGKKIEVMCFGVDGRSCLNDEGLSKYVRKYDKKGNCIETVCYGTDDNPCINKFGFSKMVVEYDEYGCITKRTLYGINNERVEAMGYHCMEIKYDECHREIMTEFYNKDYQKFSQQVYSKIIVGVSNIAQQAGLPMQSILLQWNDWKVGDSVEELSIELRKSRYSRKSLYFITPEGKIMNIYVERGSVGIMHQNYNIEKHQAEEWMKKLEAWKKKHGNK